MRSAFLKHNADPSLVINAQAGRGKATVSIAAQR
jgi:hypothetical protein